MVCWMTQTLLNLTTRELMLFCSHFTIVGRSLTPRISDSFKLLARTSFRQQTQRKSTTNASGELNTEWCPISKTGWPSSLMKLFRKVRFPSLRRKKKSLCQLIRCLQANHQEKAKLLLQRLLILMLFLQRSCVTSSTRSSFQSNFIVLKTPKYKAWLKNLHSYTRTTTL